MLKDIQPTKLTFEEVFFSSWVFFLKNFKKIILLMAAVILVIILISIVLIIFQGFGSLIFGSFNFLNYQLLIINLLFKIIGTLAILAFCSAFLILLCSLLLFPTNTLKQNIKNIKIFFWRFFFLSIIINLAGVISGLPLLAMMFISLLNPPYLLMLSAILITLFVILAAISTVFLALSPIILSEKNLKIKEAIRLNYHLAKGRFFSVLIYLFFFWLIIAVINYLIFLLEKIPTVSFILNIFFWLLVIPFLFCYLINIYKILERLHKRT